MRIAIVASHPIQYYSPWFAHITAHTGWEVKVFYLWDGRTADGRDQDFRRPIQWGRSLDEGIVSMTVENAARKPGTHHFFGLDNPGLEGEIDRFAPDVLLMHCYNYRSTLPLMWRMSRRIPVLFRGDSFTARNDGLGAALKSLGKRVLFRRLSALLCVGERNREYYCRLGIPDSCLFSVPHCVDNAWFAGSSRREQGTVEFLFVGKFIARKRPLDLVTAFRGITDGGIRLRLVGAGALEQEIRAASEGDRRIEVVGFRDQSEIREDYQRADFVVLPSDWETWGLCVNEALAAGCGAVVSDSCGCAGDLVVPGWNGFLHRTGNVDSLREALARAIGLARRGDAIGDRSRALIAEYSYDRATEGLMKAVEFVRSEKRGRK